MNELPKSVRDELARQHSAGTHPDADLLTAYSEGTATTGERTQIEQHLASCGECREVLFLAAPEKPAEAPAVVTAKPRNRWFPVWAPWAAAAAILIVGTFTLTRQHSPDSPARMAKVEPPASTPAPPSADKPAEAQKQTKEQQLHAPPNTEAAQAKTKPPVSKLDDKGATTNAKSVADAYRRDELKKSETQDSFAIASKDSNVANSAGGAPPTVAPAPEQPTYTAHAARNAAPKPGPAAPSQNQMQNQASQNIVVGSATQTVEVTSEPAPIQDEKIAGTLARSTTSMEVSAALRWRVSSSGVVERALPSSHWIRSLAKPRIKFTIVTLVGPVVWAGGSEGALFRSLDNGASWQLITLPNAGSQTISKIEFRDAQHGTVTTTARHSWTTNDAGETWQQP